MEATDSWLLQDRMESITRGRSAVPIRCESESLAGCVSQRACVYCGARVVLNPISDALHLVHGPIGCASYTWDIRGSVSSGSELFRNSFSTGLGERDVIFGGETRLEEVLDMLLARHRPPLALVYATCIVGIIGDDIQAVCRRVSARHGIPVMPVESSGFAGSKSDGYRAACQVLMDIIQSGEAVPPEDRRGINYLGDFNLAGEAWIVGSYLRQAGISVNCVLTGDSTYEQIRSAGRACLNMVQCAGSMGYLARQMENLNGIPCVNVSFLGLEDTSRSLRTVAQYFGESVQQRMEDFIERQLKEYRPRVEHYSGRLSGRKAAIYVGGGFKAISLIKQFAELGMDVVMVGTQTGRREEYAEIESLVDEETVVLDDANPSELEAFMLDQGADLLVGGVKERALAYKLGISFIDHNHDRKHPLSGYEGALNFAREVYTTICSPVWKYVRGENPLINCVERSECNEGIAD